jgi:hypothetical protein
VSQGLAPTTAPAARCDAELVAAYLAGTPVKRIGHHETVRRALLRAGHRPNRHRAWWPRALALLALGRGTSEVARACGVCRSSVRYLRGLAAADSDIASGGAT